MGMTEGTGGGIPLRPLSLGEIFNGAVTSMRRSPVASLGTAALLSVAAGVAPALATLNIDRLRLTGHLPSLAAIIAANLANLVVGFILNVLLAGFLAPVVARNLQGASTNLREAWQLARPRLPALLGTGGILLLSYGALWIPFALVLTVAAGTGQPLAIALTVLTGLATIIVEVAGWVLLSLAATAVMLERAGPVTALRRSWQLVRARFWRVAGILLLAAVVYFITAYVLVVPFDAAHTALVDFGSPRLSAPAVAVSTIGVILAGAINRPFLAGVTALVYCDIRIRREGLDLVLRGAAGERGASEAGLIWAPPAADRATSEQPGQPAW
jgi:hypothetical protein